MSASEAQGKRLLKRLDMAWTAFKESHAGLPDWRLMEPGVVGDWSVKDILAHVTTWEEALKHLPLIIEGGSPPRYVMYGGIDAFNAQMTERKRGLTLSEVQTQPDETHHRLIDFVQGLPRRSAEADNALTSSPTARYVQPLRGARRGDTAMAARHKLLKGTLSRALQCF
jgi:hypothetical protein